MPGAFFLRISVRMMWNFSYPHLRMISYGWAVERCRRQRDVMPWPPGLGKERMSCLPAICLMSSTKSWRWEPACGFVRVSVSLSPGREQACISGHSRELPLFSGKRVRRWRPFISTTPCRLVKYKRMNCFRRNQESVLIWSWRGSCAGVSRNTYSRPGS